jgi:hypothetical protein
MVLNHQLSRQKCQSPELKIPQPIFRLQMTLSLMITWDKAYFKGKFKVAIYTPEEYLQNRS